MRNVFTIILLFWSIASMAGEIIAKGTYQGKNIFVQNPLSSDRVSYCTEAVYLNNKLVLQNPKASSYEVNMSKLSVGTSVEIKIVYKDGCKPKIINPSVIKSVSNFKFTNTVVNADDISWQVEGETSNSVYYIEHYVNNNWTNVKVITAKDNQNSYSVSLKHSAGVNKYRVKHQAKLGQIAYSPTVTYNSTSGMVKFYPRNVSNKIYFTGVVSYEISNAKKQVLKKGKGRDVDVSSLQRGVYYVTFDNRTEQFLKK
ncbi:MAG: hypothetical protein SFU27_06010 [Thermonemataceae bacterium]|nr:hypothetical protein [Thermonemataceae bacterium]